MKKFLSVVLFAIMTLNLCVASVAFADNNDVLNIFSTTCDTASEIAAFSNPTIKAVNDAVAKKLGENNYAICLNELTGTTSATSNYMRINLTNDNTKTYKTYNANVTDDKKIVYKAKFYFTTEQVNEFTRHFKASSNNPHITFGPKITATTSAYASKAPFNANFAFFLKNEKFVYGNMYGTPMEISADTWHEYTAMVDFTAHTADVYIDETKVASGVTINSSMNVSNVLMCGIEFFDGTTSKSDTNSIRIKENGIYFDDIKIYQGIGNLAADADVTPKGDGTYDINVNFSTEIDSKNAALVKIADGFGVSINGTKSLSTDGRKVVLNISEATYNSLEKINVTIPITFRDANYQSFAEEKIITVTLQTNKTGIITESAQNGALDTSMSAGKNDFRPSNATVIYANDNVSKLLGDENNAVKITYAESTAIKMGRKTIPGGAFNAADYGTIYRNKPIYTKAKIYIPSTTVEKLGTTGYLLFGIGSKDNATAAVPGGRIYKDTNSSTGISMRVGRGRAVSGSSAISGYDTYEVPVDTWFEYATELSFSYSEKTAAWDYAKSRIYLNGQALSHEGAYDMTPASWYDNGFNGYMMIASGGVGADAVVYLDNIEVYQTNTALASECDVLYDEDNNLVASVEFTDKIDTNNMNLVSLTLADGSDASEYIISKTLVGGNTVKFVLDDEKLNGNGNFKIVIPTTFHDVNYQKLSESATEYSFSVPNYREVYVVSKEDAVISDDLSSVSSTIWVSNRSTSSKDAWIAFAVYGPNKKLIGIDTAEVKNIATGEEREVDLEAIGEAGTFEGVVEVKALIWESLTTMRPYQNSEDITIPQA